MDLRKRLPRKYDSIVASFREIPHENLHSVLKKEQEISSLANCVLKKYVFIPNRSFKEKIYENWAEVVGEKLAPFCSPQKLLPSGVLIIHVRNSIVRQELLMKKDIILQNIQKFGNGSTVSRIVFTS